ncbi:MAG TPA: flavodoxin domain-containing protein [Streptosporangiaceae bacterium]
MVVLVGYTTMYGSTRGVGERIADRLRRRGIAVEVRAMSGIDDLGKFDAVVLGSAVHGGKWLPAAARFVDHNAARLRRVPVWLFSVSTLGDEDGMYPPGVARRLRALRKETAEIAGFRAAVGAREHRNFAGVIAPSHWPATGRAFFRLMGGRYGDHRNWPAIEAWADRIAAQVAPRTAVTRDAVPPGG